MASKDQDDMLYLPVFFNWYEITKELSDEDFGILIRALLKDFSRGETDGRGNEITDCGKEVGKHLRIVYKFMKDGASRTIESHRKAQEARREGGYRRWGKSEKEEQKEPPKPKTRYGDFNPEEAFERALARGFKGLRTDNNGKV